jgi:hypothetical protein
MKLLCLRTIALWGIEDGLSNQNTSANEGVEIFGTVHYSLQDVHLQIFCTVS